MVETFPIPTLFHDNKFITDFKVKSEIFNPFFAKQCSLIDNGSTLPSLLPLITEKSLSNVDCSVEVIETSSANLTQIKLMVAIWSLFACLNYVINPFVNLLVLSPNLAWRKAFSHLSGEKKMSYQFIKKYKQFVTNYRPVSLLPISSKVLGRIISNTMFTYFIESNLISKNQSGFKPSKNFRILFLVKIDDLFDNLQVILSYSRTTRSCFLLLKSPKEQLITLIRT